MGEARPLSEETKEALARWAARSGCRLCVLFGSAGSESAAPGDVDLALAFDALPGPERRLSIIGELQDLCGRRRVDVVFLRTETAPVLRFEVFRTGRPLHEARAGLFVEETVRALALYEDALPFRRRLRESLARRRGPTGSGDLP